MERKAISPILVRKLAFSVDTASHPEPALVSWCLGVLVSAPEQRKTIIPTSARQSK